MLFHVGMTIRIPHDVAPERIKELTAKEHERATELERQGKWLHAWRVAGKWANVSIFEVSGPEELHEILNSLPLFRSWILRSRRSAPCREKPGRRRHD